MVKREANNPYDTLLLDMNCQQYAIPSDRKEQSLTLSTYVNLSVHAKQRLLYSQSNYKYCFKSYITWLWLTICIKFKRGLFTHLGFFFLDLHVEVGWKQQQQQQQQKALCDKGSTCQKECAAMGLSLALCKQNNLFSVDAKG